jgi:hypothetical protein
MNKQKITVFFIIMLFSITCVNAQNGYISPYINSLGGNKIAKSVSNLISALSACMGLLYAFQIYQKMQKGEEEITNKIYIWLTGFILLFVGSMFVSWFFFQDVDTIKIY